MPRDDRVGALIAQAIDGQAQSITLLLEAVVGLREDMRALREDLGPSYPLRRHSKSEKKPLSWTPGSPPQWPHKWKPSRRQKQRAETEGAEEEEEGTSSTGKRLREQEPLSSQS